MLNAHNKLRTNKLDFIINYLLDIANNKTSTGLKGDALKALGKLSVIVDKMHFSEDYVYKITLAIGIEIASVKSSHFNDALEALSNLCKVQGDAFDQHTDVIDLINVLFRDGLSNELIKTLEELSKIKGKMYKKPIQVKLLNVISLVLSDKQFSFSKNIAQYRKHSDEGSSRFGRENSLESGSILLFPNEAKSTLKELDSMNKETMRKLMNKDVDKKVKEIVQSESREMMIILALATLSNFDFSDFAESLTHFFDE